MCMSHESSMVTVSLNSIDFKWRGRRLAGCRGLGAV